MSGLDGVDIILQRVSDAAHAATPDRAVRSAADAVARAVGADVGRLLIADYGGNRLVRVGDEGEHSHVEDSVAGRALLTQQLQMERVDGACHVFAPVSDRGDRIGVLEVLCRAEPDPEMLQVIQVCAHQLAHITVSSARFTDALEWGQRSKQVSLAAEIQRRLLPDAFTCATEEFTLTGWLEPAYEAGGDTFDYTVGDGELSVSMTDAMGHGVQSALLATLAVNALRNSRRSGHDVAAQVEAANRALAEHMAVEQFVTGLVLKIDLHSGLTQVTNAGHPPLWLVRDGRVEQMTLHPDPPMGMFAEATYRSHELALTPGDRLVLVSDGMLEVSEPRGADLERVLDEQADCAAQELVHLCSERIRQRVGYELPDDATVVVVDWHPDR